MAASGIPIGSSLRYTSPIPVLTNAAFANSAGRLAPGQLRHTAWDYHEQDTATYWRVKPLAQCFLADGTTPATQAGTWGTLGAHWTPQGTGTGAGGPAIATTDDLPSGLNADRQYFGVLPNSRLQALEARVHAVAPDGVTYGFTTVQEAADYTSQNGGGTIYTANDIIGTVTLSGNTSLIAPSATLSLAGNPSAAALILSNCNGRVWLKAINRTGGVTGLAVSQNGGVVQLIGDVYAQGGYNAISCTNGTLNYTGTATLVSRASYNIGGEKITVLANGAAANVVLNGRIVIDSDTLQDALVAVFNSSVVCNSSIQVLTQGYAVRCVQSRLDVYGTITSADRGIRYINSGFLNIYGTVDLRGSLSTGQYIAPLILARFPVNATAGEHVTLWPSASLLAPTGQAITENGTGASMFPQTLRIVGVPAISGAIDANTTVSYVTTQPSGGPGGSTPQATSTTLGTVRGGGTGNVTVNGDGSLTAPTASGSGITAAQLEAVRTKIALGSTKTSSFTLALADAGNMIAVNSASDAILTIPTNATVLIPDGTVIYLRPTGAGAIVISPTPISASLTAVPSTAGTVKVRHPDGHGRSAKVWGDCFLQYMGNDDWVFSGYTAI